MSEEQFDVKASYRAIVMDFLGRLESGDMEKLRELQLVSEKLMRTMKLYQLEAKDSWRGLKYMLEGLKGEDIYKLDDSSRRLRGKRISGYLEEILKKVPEKERDDLYEVLARVLLSSSSGEGAGRQREYRSPPRTQPVSQPSGAQPQGVLTQHAYQQPQPTQPVSQPSGAQPQAGGQYSQQSSVLTYRELIELARNQPKENLARKLIGREVYLSGGEAGKIIDYRRNPYDKEVYIVIERTKDRARFAFTVEELLKELEEGEGTSSNFYLTLFLVALSGILPLLFLRTPVSSLLILPSRHHFLPIFILLLSLALFFLAKRALK